MARKKTEAARTPSEDAALLTLGKERVETIRKLMRIADFDPRRVVAADGRPLRMDELAQDVATALQSVEIVRELVDDGADGETLIRETYCYQFADKVGALGILADMLGLTGPDRVTGAPVL